MSDLQVKPRLAPERPKGFQAPATAGLNPAAPLLDTAAMGKTPARKDPSRPYALLDSPNDFQGHTQYNQRFAADRVLVQRVTVSGTTLSLNYGMASVTVGGSTFEVNLPTPDVPHDPATGDAIAEGFGILVKIIYTGAGAPSFPGAALPGDADPDWSSAAGLYDLVGLVWDEGWSLVVLGLGYAS